MRSVNVEEHTVSYTFSSLNDLEQIDMSAMITGVFRCFGNDDWPVLKVKRRAILCMAL